MLDADEYEERQSQLEVQLRTEQQQQMQAQALRGHQPPKSPRTPKQQPRTMFARALSELSPLPRHKLRSGASS